MAKRYQKVIGIRISKKNKQHNGQKIPKGNRNPYIEEGQKTQWTKEKGQKDKQRSTKHTRKTKDRVTRTPLKIMGELRCSGKVSTSSNKSMTLFQPSCIYQM
jgi:LysM repeat protein